MTYNHVRANVGNSIDIETGIFTAPVDGVFRFSFAGILYSDESFGPGDVRAYKNGHSFYRSYTKSTADQLTTTWSMELKSGDTVHVWIANGAFYASNDGFYIHFIGQLL